MKQVILTNMIGVLIDNIVAHCRVIGRSGNYYLVLHECKKVSICWSSDAKAWVQDRQNRGRLWIGTNF